MCAYGVVLSLQKVSSRRRKDHSENRLKPPRRKCSHHPRNCSPRRQSQVPSSRLIGSVHVAQKGVLASTRKSHRKCPTEASLRPHDQCPPSLSVRHVAQVPESKCTNWLFSNNFRDTMKVAGEPQEDPAESSGQSPENQDKDTTTQTSPPHAQRTPYKGTPFDGALTCI